MSTKISTINFSGVNCYLVRIDTNFILIDNGYPAKFKFLDKELNRHGCNPGNLKLVILTHGDHDHAGNSVFLKDKYGTNIAIHADDSVMVQEGDMNWNRKKKSDKFSFRFRMMSIMSIFFNPGEFKTFIPDIYLDENFDLTAYNFDAKIICTPGHSKGSISILTGDGSLFCGDFLYNFFGNPELEFCDNLEDFNESVKKLKNNRIKIFYPGHGKPFTIEEFLKKY